MGAFRSVVKIIKVEKWYKVDKSSCFYSYRSTFTAWVADIYITYVMVRNTRLRNTALINIHYIKRKLFRLTTHYWYSLYY